ncbi:MAG: trehalose-6-phosphate synthase [Candidatus Krumholzibacteriia bacterium]
MKAQRLITVSNRLPVVLSRDGESGAWDVKSGSGGLVTALAPVLRDRGGLWIGWPGVVAEDEAPVAELLKRAAQNTGYTLAAVELTAEQRVLYYRGWANEVIWPLFHDLQSLCRFDPAYWRCSQHVQQRFAEVVQREAGESDFIWVHDYHLTGLGHVLRQRGLQNRIAFFLHIPFPPLDIFLKLPWRFQILRELLEYDLVGFQTARDRRNFVSCLRSLDRRDLVVHGRASRTHVHYRGREVLLGNFPISIDYGDFARRAASQEVAESAWYIHEQYPERTIILGIDRLDYTKGVPEKLRAYRSALRRYPDLRGRTTLVQVVVPSRWQIPHYTHLKEEIERLVGQINGEFTRPGWIPVHYIFRSLTDTELLGYYRTAEIMLTTPWKDGMNLVAKEYCTCNVDENGVLILSEFAGAVAQLHRYALLVNPHDIDGLADAIHRAMTMPVDERQERMRRLRRSIRRQDIFWWVNAFLEAAVNKRLESFPLQLDYVPDPDGDPDRDPGAPDPGPRAAREAGGDA